MLAAQRSHPRPPLQRAAALPETTATKPGLGATGSPSSVHAGDPSRKNGRRHSRVGHTSRQLSKCLMKNASTLWDPSSVRTTDFVLPRGSSVHPRSKRTSVTLESLTEQRSMDSRCLLATGRISRFLAGPPRESDHYVHEIPRCIHERPAIDEENLVKEHQGNNHYRNNYHHAKRRVC